MADVYLPANPGANAFKDGKKLDVEAHDGTFIVQVGSGAYTFEVN
jgi:arylamine N-acetyltransferase